MLGFRSGSRRARAGRYIAEAIEPRRMLAAVSWDGGGDGASWHDPLNWSGDVEPGEFDDVTIDVAGEPTIELGQPYTTIRTLASNEKLRIGAILIVGRTNYSPPGIAVADGGDVVLNAFTKISYPGEIRFRGNLVLANDVSLSEPTDTYGGRLDFWGYQPASITGTGTITASVSGVVTNYDDYHTLTIGSDITVAGKWIAIGGGRIENRGTLLPQGGNWRLGTYREYGERGGFLHRGVLHAAGTTIDSSFFTNDVGALLTLDHSTMSMGSNYTVALPVNSGNLSSIELIASTLNFGGVFRPEAFGRIIPTSDSVVDIRGTFDLNGSTYLLDGFDLHLGENGEIRNGTLASMNGERLIVNAGKIGGLTLDLPVLVRPLAGSYVQQGIFFVGDVTLNRTMTFDTGTLATHYIVLSSYSSFDTTFGGTGSIRATGVGRVAMLNQGEGVPKWTIGSGIDIEVGYLQFTGNYQTVTQFEGTLRVSGGQTAVVGGGRFINNGDISVTGGSRLDAINLINAAGRTIRVVDSILSFVNASGNTVDTWQNDGTVLADHSSIYLGGTFGPAALGTINRVNGGTVNIVGTLELAAGVWTIQPSRHGWNLTSGRIRNGTLRQTGEAELNLLGGTFENVRLEMPIRVAGGATLNIERGLWSNKLITLGDNSNTSGSLKFVGSEDQGFGAHGRLRTEGTGANAVINAILRNNVGGVLDLFLYCNVTNLSMTSAYPGGIIEGQTDPSVAAGGQLRLGSSGTTFRAHTRIQTDTGAVVSVTGYAPPQYSYISLDDAELRLAGEVNLQTLGDVRFDWQGEVNITGTLDLQGETLLLDGTLRDLGVRFGGRIRNGTIATTGEYQLIGRGGTLENIVLDAPLIVAANFPLNIERGIVNNCVITLGDAEGTSGTLNFGGIGDQEVAGEGVIRAVGSEGGYIQSLATNPETDLGYTLILGAKIEVLGTSLRFRMADGGSIINRGTIGSTQPNGVFHVESAFTSTFRNLGVLRASCGGVTRIDSLSGDLNSIELNDSGSRLEIGGNYTVNLPLAVGAESLLALRGDWQLLATLDVKGGVLFDYASAASSPFDSIYGRVVAGYAGGSWNGEGIRSSFAAGESGFAVGVAEATEVFTSDAAFMGANLDATAVVVRCTRLGDVNLDAQVNFVDLLTLAQHFGSTSAHWSAGDFNYDGNIDFDDLLELSRYFVA